MIIEIKAIDTDAMGAIVAGLDLIHLQELANVFMRWSFEAEWPAIQELKECQIKIVIAILDAACRHYSIRFDDAEYTKREIDEDEEDAPDL